MVLVHCSVWFKVCIFEQNDHNIYFADEFISGYSSVVLGCIQIWHMNYEHFNFIFSMGGGKHWRYTPISEHYFVIFVMVLHTHDCNSTEVKLHRLNFIYYYLQKISLCCKSLPIDIKTMFVKCLGLRLVTDSHTAVLILSLVPLLVLLDMDN